MAVTAATRADCFVHAWRERKWLTQEEYPPAPASLTEMYETHLAIQQHPLVASEFGGHAGYKLGAIGAEGEPCLYAPLFSSYIVAAPGDGLSAAAINLWQLEPEIGFVMGAGLPPRADGTPHTHSHPPTRPFTPSNAAIHTLAWPFSHTVLPMGLRSDRLTRVKLS